MSKSNTDDERPATPRRRLPDDHPILKRFLGWVDARGAHARARAADEQQAPEPTPEVEAES